MSTGVTETGVPLGLHYADVVDGKLYLFVNAEIFERYKQDRAGTIAKANEFWKKLSTFKPVSSGDAACSWLSKRIGGA